MLDGLVAHELCHVAHFHWRNTHMPAEGEDPWWQLYIERFATYGEHLVMGEESWHMMGRKDHDWLNWCRTNISWLAAEFLRRVTVGESVWPFLGSWYDLRSYKQTGYFIGQELIDKLAEGHGLLEIALLEDYPYHLRQLLEEFGDPLI